MDIEALAVSKIQDLVARCPHLQPFIDSNDKTPFTDGHIDLYKTPSRKKQDRIGRVSVQVKGRKIPRNPKQRSSFSITRTDLLGFQQESGVLYFVVYVDKKGDGTPYHAILTPFAIDHLLSQVPAGQEYLSVQLKPLPQTPDELERIAHISLKGRNQNPSLGVDPVLFEKMQSITISTASELNWDAPFTLTPGETDFVLEMKTSGGASVPLSGALQVFPSDYVEHEIKVTIRAGDFTYDHARARRIDPEKVELVLVGGLSLVLTSPPEKRFNINVTPHSNFSERRIALGFVVALADHRQLEINGETLSLGYTPSDDAFEHQIVEIRNHSALLQKLHELLEHLGVDGRHLDLSEISEEQLLSLRTLYNAFIKGEQMVSEGGETGWAIVKIGQWAIMVLIRPGDAPDRWRLTDPFDPITPHPFPVRHDPEEEGTDLVDLVTSYEILEKEEVHTILNLRLDSVTRAYDAIAHVDKVSSRATLFVLNLISAADTCPRRREEFLLGAKELNEWVIAKDGDVSVNLVNRWQIEWRNGNLDNQDRDEIRELKHTVAQTKQDLASEIELACALLLGEDEEANYLARQMSQDQLKQMEAWPIWRLRDRTDR